jgi:class 3 adenylate cyclase
MVVSTISEWLSSLGMSEYAERFAESDIDPSVLRDLTDQDLKDLAVSLGHRRKMLRAINELAGAIPATPQPAPVTAPAHDTAERRQLTVMFCDLVGSTALSARLDPEDLRGIIGAYHRCATELLQRHGGFVAKYRGDGVLAYFGYPRAHEHDAERAVRGALSMAASVSELGDEHGVDLQVRVGIATGVVVVGDLVGDGDAQERGIVGETPNLAARLQGLASRGEVVICKGTRRLAGSLFDCEDLGAVPLKGFDGPVRAWRVTCARAVESRFEARHGPDLTPLVGREEELDVLLRRWRQSGEGRVVLVSGEPGIGTSTSPSATTSTSTSYPTLP